MKLQFASSLKTALSLLCAAGLVATVGTATASALELKAETGSSPSSVQASVVTDAFAKDLAERTNGDIKVDITYGGARAQLTGIADAIGSGLLDLGVVATIYTPGIFPIWSALAFTDFRLTTGGDLVAINAIAATILQEFPALDEEVAKHNIKIVGFMPLDELVLYTNGPVATLADIKGKKIRGSSEGAVRTLNEGGAIGVSLPWAEVHTSLQTGLLDGVWTNAGWGVATKTHEIAKNATYLDIRAALPTVVLGMNRDKYESLSDEQKAALNETYKKMLVDFADLIQGERTDSLKTLQSDPAVTYSELPAAEREKWMQNTPDGLAETAKLLDAKGFPGAAITARVRELYDAYNAGTWDPKEAIANAKL